MITTKQTNMYEREINDQSINQSRWIVYFENYLQKWLGHRYGEFPARFPTQFPTRFPTEFPTRFPTRFPAEFPARFLLNIGSIRIYILTTGSCLEWNKCSCRYVHWRIYSSRDLDTLLYKVELELNMHWKCESPKSRPRWRHGYCRVAKYDLVSPRSGSRIH